LRGSKERRKKNLVFGEEGLTGKNVVLSVSDRTSPSGKEISHRGKRRKKVIKSSKGGKQGLGTNYKGETSASRRGKKKRVTHRPLAIKGNRVLPSLRE